MRKLGAFLVLVLLAFAVWIGARYIRHRGEVKVTIIFREAARLAAGDPVVERNVVVGRIVEVSRVNEQDAVTVRIARDHRRAILHDSLFEIESHRLIVTNAVAVGAPVADGEIIYAKEDRLSRWLAKHGASVQPLIDKLKKTTDEQLDALTTENFDDKLAEWKAELPQWKKEGSASVDRRVAELEARVGAMTRQLERSNRAEEARRLKERFQTWVNDIRK
jgi:ABC-type transporter Mla subunit MlaD